MPSRDHNSMLFEFDSIIDMELSVVHFIQKNYDTMQNPKWFDKSVLYQSDDVLKPMQIYNDNAYKLPVLKNIFKPEYKKNRIIESVYSIILKRYYKDILNENIVVYTAMKKYIKTCFSTAKEAGIRIGIVCSADEEKDLLSRIFPGITIIQGQRNEIDLSLYGRIVIGDIKTLYKYIDKNKEHPGAKNFLILNYRKNFEKEDSSLLIARIVVIFKDVNEFEIANTYIGIEAPEG